MENNSICIKNIGKCYQIYETPISRLKQSLFRNRRTFYREFWALRDISFKIAHGETVGIIGSNGSGKSTLLQIIAGILRPTTGEMEIYGKVAALLELGAGFNPEYTGRENVFMNAAIIGLTRDEIEARYENILEFAEIGDFINQPVKTYSSGMYVRLAFATAINLSPEILAVDEALAVGDLRFQMKCIAKIKQFCEKGTVIFVSHDMAMIRELCSRTIWIESGQIRMDGKPKEVVDRFIQFMYEEIVPENERMNFLNKKETVVDDEVQASFIPIDLNCRQLGNGSLFIEKVRFVCEDLNPGVIYSDRPCEISVVLKSNKDIRKPILGYAIKDRLGREIIGDRFEKFTLSGNQRYRINLKIRKWPNLIEDDYTLCVGIAEGSLEDHVPCHFLYDTMVFRSVPLYPPGGLFSIIETDFQIKAVS